MAVAWLACSVRSVHDWDELVRWRRSPASHVLVVGEVVDAGETDRLGAHRRTTTPSSSMADTRMNYGGLSGSGRRAGGHRSGQSVDVPSDGRRSTRKIEDAVLDGGLGVAQHGVVHEVGLGLLDEALAVRTLDGWQTPVADRLGPGPEARHHLLRDRNRRPRCDCSGPGRRASVVPRTGRWSHYTGCIVLRW